MDPNYEDWLIEGLDFFGMDAFPHGSFETFPSPSEADGIWWTDSSVKDECYSVIPREPYFQLIHRNKLLFIIVCL